MYIRAPLSAQLLSSGLILSLLSARSASALYQPHPSLLQILTKDSVTAFVNAIMYYKVANATHAVSNVDDYSGSARLLAATTLRNVLGTMTLGDILCNREAIAKEMKVNSDSNTSGTFRAAIVCLILKIEIIALSVL